MIQIDRRTGSTIFKKCYKYCSGCVINFLGRFSVCTYVRTYVRPSPPLRAQEPARQALDPASQASEPARQASEPARQASEPVRQASEPASQASEALRPAWLALRPDWLGLRPAWLLGPRGGGRTHGRTDERMDGCMEGKSPHSTGLCPLSRPLPKKRGPFILLDSPCISLMHSLFEK